MRKLILLSLLAACSGKTADKVDSQVATPRGRDLLPAGDSRLPVPGDNGK